MAERDISDKRPRQSPALPEAGLTPKAADRQTLVEPLPADKADLIWEQWKYRHEFFWKGFYTVTMTTALVSTLPLFKTDIVSTLKWFALAFPLFGLGFGYLGRTLLLAEYKRLGAVGDAYDTAPWSYGTKKEPPYRTNVGKPVGELLRPAMRAVLLWLPIAAAAAIAFVLIKPL